jgi:hypothetical protein
MERRRFVAGMGSLAALMAARAGTLPPGNATPHFRTADRRWQAAYDKALAVLAGNIRTLPYVSRPVLIEGSVYQGIWMECGPHEALVYRKFAPQVARDSHLTFFELQRADGQLPANNKVTETSFGQIQMVVPIAATAWKLARATGDGALLEGSYAACAQWDAWLVRHRNTRGTGLVEGFCTYDTGMDNSPRWRGVPPQCPNKDAKRHADLPILPFLSPDLSATTYGARRALAEMAMALGRRAEADRWTEQAERLRTLIMDQLWVEEDGAFYDLDATGRHNRVRCDILTRMCGEHVPDTRTFDVMWARQLGNPRAFWTAYPFPSVAIDDPSFVRPIPGNSWGGASQALTALRAGRWMDHYRRSAEFGTMMEAWTRAIVRDPSFRQQVDPLSGAFTAGDAPDYSPAALVMMDYTWRLAGIQDEPDALFWNVRPGHAAAHDARFTLPLDGGGTAAMHYDPRGADLSISGKALGRVEGVARLVTDRHGNPTSLVGIATTTQRVTLRRRGDVRTYSVAPNAVVTLR